MKRLETRLRLRSYLFLCLLPALVLGGCSSSDDTPAPADPVTPTTGDDDPSGNGSTTEGDGVATDGDGSATDGDGSATDGGGSATDGDGSATDGDGSATDGDGNGLTTDGDGDGGTDSSEPRGDYDNLVNAVKKTAAIPLLRLQQKVSSGEALTNEETACLGSFDPALGKAVDSFQCDETPLLAASDFALVESAVMEESEACRASISAGNVDSCSLASADIEIRIEWVQDLSRMANGVRPIQGATISLFAGFLEISDDTDGVPPFNCVILLEDASISSEDISPGDCNAQVLRITSRLNELLPQPDA